MHSSKLLIDLWQTLGYRPNDQQAEAILYGDGPLFLPAGPGAGKTRVLMWRVVHLLAEREVPVEKLFVATFTEKAARQLRDGLRTLLGLVTQTTGRPFDTAKLYVGTVHSLCHRFIYDRQHSDSGWQPPVLLDELGQYLFLRRKWVWQDLVRAAGGDDWDNTWINEVFGSQSKSRHVAITNCVALFNRLTDECFDPIKARRASEGASPTPSLPRRASMDGKLLKMFAEYRELLANDNLVDFATLQQKALDATGDGDESDSAFEHVIVDEYQDTNTIQERLFFRLAARHRNLCVVGDDDQALYRFRGATVENLVDFPDRCRRALGVEPHTVVLATNYRSRKTIVQFSTKFMSMCDWRPGELFDDRSYRIEDKPLHAARRDDGPAVIASAPGSPDGVCREIAGLARRLIDQEIVTNPNQIAFLFPSLKSKPVARMRQALEEAGLQVYAPRAGRFVEVDEAKAMLGLLFNILGKPQRGSARSRDYVQFHNWVDDTCALADKLAADDDRLAKYVGRRAADVTRSAADFRKLQDVAKRNGWDFSSLYEPSQMSPALTAAAVSGEAISGLRSKQLRHMASRRRRTPYPVSLRYALNRATALPWTVLDVFHKLCGAAHFREMFDRAESLSGAGLQPACDRHAATSGRLQTCPTTRDEGPLCNLGLVSQYLGRFVEEFHWLLTGERLATGWYPGAFEHFLYALFRRGESEYEDADDPFPQGRIPLITVHQAKGLEFPVVVLGNPRKSEQPQPLEELVQPLLDRDGEPIERQGKFDAMRLFYVALTRAKNLVVLPNYHGSGQTMNAPFSSLIPRLPQIGELDCATVPAAERAQSDLPRTISYTGDYVPYRQCPRQYYIFRQREFVPARAQPMFFGRLVHETLCGLHRELIGQRAGGVADPCVDDRRLRQLFDATYRRLQTETGYILLSEVREVAWRQVQMYWRRLPHIALSVTEPEVKLQLPNQRTPKGRRYAIEGVVDIVAGDNGVTVYDIKTCDAEEVQANMEVYRGQLAVYAHVWNRLNPARPVRKAEIISTALPDAVNEAIHLHDEEALSQSLSAWNPIIPVPLADDGVATALHDFGRVADLIEDGQFAPPSSNELATRTGNLTFAQRICASCDARFSCASFRHYVENDRGGGTSFSENAHTASEQWRRDAGLSDDGQPRDDFA